MKRRPALSEGARGTLLVLLGAVMISFSAVFVKVAHVGPTTSAFYRMAFGGLLLFLIAFITGNLVGFGGSILWPMGLCALCFTCDLTIWHRSIFYVGPGLATILANFQVFFLAGVGFLFYKERLSFRYLVSVPLALTGLGLLIRPGRATQEPHFYLGILLGLSTAVAYTGYLLALRNLQKNHPQLSALFAIAVISLLTAFALGIEILLTGQSFVIPDTTSWAALLGYGILGQVLGWVFISKGIGLITASRVGLILLLQPTLSFIWDILFFRRPTTWVDVMGALLALLAIYLGATSHPSPA